MNTIKPIFLKTIIMTMICISFFNCSPATSTLPSTPEIPGTDLIDLQLPSHGATIAAGDTFQYKPPDKVTYLVLVIGDSSAGLAPLKVSGQSVVNAKYGCTTDMGMGRNSVATTSIKVYDSSTGTFSGTPTTAPFTGSWFVVGYDTNMNLIASSPKWDVTVNSW